MKRSAVFIIPLVLSAAGVAVPQAHAGCHLIDCVENVYVEPKQLSHASCETLWILRNSIYKDAKYCFQTPRAAAWFGNDGCLYSEQELVPLNDYQRSNVSVIKGVEAEQGC
jgi:hypothetical protein